MYLKAQKEAVRGDIRSATERIRSLEDEIKQIGNNNPPFDSSPLLNEFLSLQLRKTFSRDIKFDAFFK